MMVQLTPDQVGEHWDKISNAITKANPEVTSEYIAKCLESTIQGRVQVWAITDGEKINALSVTGFFLDPTGVRSLIVMALEGTMSQKDYDEGSQALWQFAKSYKCSFIGAFVSEEKIVQRYREVFKNLEIDESTYLNMKV